MAKYSQTNDWDTSVCMYVCRKMNNSQAPGLDTNAVCGWTRDR